MRSLVSLLIVALLVCPAMADDPPKHATSIDVIAVAPVDGIGLERDKFPTNAQRVARPEGADASESLLRAGTGTELNNPAGGPLQSDLQFRGFSVSSLLGASQGLALFQDGVRLNEPFGDTVAWSTVPSAAIESIEVTPGANPVFGLNALGGALTLRTRSSAHETSALLRAGSYGRADAEMATGGERWFAAASHLRDDGWRAFSPSEATQLFGSARWLTGDMRITLARSTLTGNGATPEDLLALDRSAVFTHPDQTRNETAMVSVAQQHVLTSSLFLQTLGYGRRTRSRTFNGDDSPYESCDGFLCLEDEPVRDLAGNPVPLDPAHDFDATNNRSDLQQNAFGLTVQIDGTGAIRGRANRILAGASLDGGTARFRSSTELARLRDDRGTTGTGLFDSGSLVNLTTRSSTVSAFLADILTATPRLTVTASARINHARMKLDDRLGTALDGEHSFTQAHPSLGAALEISPSVSAFANIGFAGRTPTPVELSCADPEDPCRLPNAFVSDPPLRAVKSRTLEAGLRGVANQIAWSAAVHQSTSEDDLLFISSGPLRGEGHFANVGTTRRRGIELAAGGRVARRGQWSGSYAFLDATFASPFIVPAPNHPGASDGEIAVERGDRLPLVPRHVFKLGATVDLTSRIRAAASFRATAEQFFRGDEGNLAEPLPAYIVADARAEYAVTRRVRILVDVQNVFDRDYATFGTFGDAEDVLGDEYEESTRFITPAAPRLFTAGVAVQF